MAASFDVPAPAGHRFPFSDPLRIEGRRLPVADVLAALGPQISSHRRERIDAVIAERSFNTCVVLDQLHDHGNISAVLRTCEALGFPAVHVVEEKEPFRVARGVTHGAHKWIELSRWDQPVACVERLLADGYRVAAAVPDADQAVDDLDVSEPLALVLGSEHRGVSPEVLERADVRVSLPMCGFTQSFNISVAAALCLARLGELRRRRFQGNGDLTLPQQRILRAAYWFRAVRNSRQLVAEYQKRRQTSRA